MTWASIEGLPGQYRWAADLDVHEVPKAGAVLVCGMGGSGISGDYARVVAATDGGNVRVHKDYGLPSWTRGVRPLVIAVSYSGRTAETRSAVDDALRMGLDVAIVAAGGDLGARAAKGDFPGITVPGGLQPRAALGYLAGSVLRLIAGAGIIHDPVADLREAASEVQKIVDRSGAGHDQARSISANLAASRLVVVWGSSGPSGVAAQRWAKQMHENAKTPAYWSLLPELDHNELVAWANTVDSGAGIVLIRDGEERAEISRRFELTRELIDDRLIAGEVWANGRSAIARAASASVMGDLVSEYLAEARGVDPGSIAVLEELKNRL